METLTRAVDAARREAVAHKRAGDMVSARAALTKSKELRVLLDAAAAALEASRNTERDTEHAKDTPKADDVDTMIAEAIGTVVKIISDDPDSKVTARRKKPQKDEGDSEPGGDHDDDDDDDDDALLRRELGDDYEAQREHWAGTITSRSRRARLSSWRRGSRNSKIWSTSRREPRSSGSGPGITKARGARFGR